MSIKETVEDVGAGCLIIGLYMWPYVLLLATILGCCAMCNGWRP